MSAIRRDGTIAIKIISPGWGASGFYPPEVLERDGPRVFTAKTKMYWNHATATEEALRPEGDLNQLAAELISAARWEPNGQAGPGLYADAKVFEPYRGPVNELAPHIGVSIRATGKTTTGQAEGRKGPVIEAITGAKSVDFVTIPGAGGQILQLFESARNGQFSPHKEESMNEQERQQLKEAVEGMKALTAANMDLRRQLAQSQAERQITQALANSTLPAPAHNRVLAEALRHAPIGETGVLDVAKLATVIVEAIKAEETYLQSLSESGRIVGMGPGTTAGGNGDPAKDTAAAKAAEERMKEAFAGLGLADKELGHAITGHAM